MEKRKHLYGIALILAVATVFYNLAEGAVSVFFGMEDDTLALFGFGLDSFVEVISGIGIWHMVVRVSGGGSAAMENPDIFERRALRITGGAFYLLTFGLMAGAVIQTIKGVKPQTTFWGIVISLASLSFMWMLVHYKTKVGKGLGSQALLADAACSKVCMYLSVILLAASAGYEATGIGGLDQAGALGIAWFSYREGKEAFEQARSGALCGCSCSCKEPEKPP